MARVFCLIVGYLCGCFLRTAGAFRRAGQDGAHPRSADLAEPGRSAPAALVGDALSTALACGLCRYALFPALGRMAALYAGLGAVMGLCYPVWRQRRAGKGLAATCTALVFFSPLGGLASGLTGLLTVLLTGYLPVGAVAIPLVALFPVLRVYGYEAGALVAALGALMFTRHLDGLLRTVRGQEERIWRRP